MPPVDYSAVSTHPCDPGDLPGCEQNDDDSGRNMPEVQAWTPFYLRKSTLLGFIACDLTLLFGIVVLAIVDKKRDGLSTVDPEDHYLWTFGPTASQSAIFGHLVIRLPY